MVHIDGFALLFRAIFLIAAALAIAISIRYLDIEREQHGEYYALILFATVGMMFLGAGYDLISLYIALELMALTFYVLVAFTKRERRSNEAGHEILSARARFHPAFFCTACRWFTGSPVQLTWARSARSLGNTGELRPLLLIGMIALAAGLFFKVAAVPFHMWAPDAYEGAPTSVTAFLSTGSKAASFALYARIFFVALGPMQADWAPLAGYRRGADDCRW